MFESTREKFMKNRLIVNPTTDDFRDAVAAEVFVDKSELIHYTNSVMNTPQKLTCFSRPAVLEKRLQRRC